MPNTNSEIFDRPKTLKELAQRSNALEDFGRNLRDWQHEISRRVSSSKDFKLRLQEAPELLAEKFESGKVADAYLAAYADWLSGQANLQSPHWVKDPQRRLNTPWYADSNQTQLESLAPESFRIRGVYTVPESIFNPRRGRPKVSAEQKRLKAIERQRQYRKRIKALVEKARALDQ
ncbi:MAG: hypothetical protein O3C20_24365 [Verrucomicrobia bacterium]|nr:hypothetical protein [Verrucomicrobiota bacterium]